MKKIYSIVLMATALLIGTNVNAVEVSSAAQLKEKIEAATGDLTLELTKDLTGDDAVPNAGALGAEYKLNGNPTGLYKAGTASATPWITIQNGQNVVLDLQGHAIESGNCLRYMFKILHGHITIKSTGSRGRIQSNHKEGSAVKIRKVSTPITSNPDSTIAYSPSSGYPFHIIGKVTPDIDGWYSWLTIEDNVDIIGHASAATIYNNGGTKPNRFSYGSYIEVKAGAMVSGGKYGLQISGTVDKPADDLLDFAYLPKITVEKQAKVRNNQDAVYASGVYSGGYAKVEINGDVKGSTGVYAKSGQIAIGDGAVIASSSDQYVSPNGRSAGTAAQGSAIVMDSNAAYAGGMELSVTGDAQIKGNGGYAVEAEITTSKENQVEGITIGGGNFESGLEGCLDMTPVISDPTAEIKIDGGSYDAADEIAVVLAATGDAHIVAQSQDEYGNDIVVILPLEDGKTVKKNLDLNNLASDVTDVELAASTQTLNKDIVLHSLSLKAEGTPAVASKVTIAEGKTLTVTGIVLDATSQIILEAGAKLIVGENGIAANQVSNVIIGAEEGKMAMLLMDPDVKGNVHPKATVQFVSKSYFKSSSDFLNQRFGIPTNGALESITAEFGGNPVATRIWGYFNGKWDVIGDLPTLDPSKMDKPFAYYQMSNNNAQRGTVVTMAGRLVGVENPTLDVTANDWATFSNSFMANMNAMQMMAMFEGHDNIDATLQTFTPTSANSFAWFPFNYANVLLGEVVNIEPMQAFIIKNNGAADQLQMNFKDMVWKPIQDQASHIAARRHAAVEMTTARIEVSNAAGVRDYVTLLEDNQFSAEYNNGFDAEKVMNNTLDIYTVGTMNLATVATNNLNNTVLGLACAEAGEYTISFSQINGDNLTLIDRQTGARIAMVEGNTYNFVAEANTTNRFEIVGIHNAPTAVENVSTVSNGAVYTLMGQYVGTVEDWNTLPAGIYVVDGVKCVK